MVLGGGIMASGTISAMQTGETVTIVGLAIQLLFFSVFIITSTIFHLRIRSKPTSVSLETPGMADWKTTSWETIMLTLYAASILILVRSIFRVIEYAQGNAGYLISHEVFMYVFDSMLMFFTMIVMAVYHPSKLLSSRGKSTRIISWESRHTSTQLRPIGPHN
jgi:magnesium-transporting ATPase (P-type)